MPNSSYPPQHTQSAMSAMLGQINDLAGSNSTLRSMTAPAESDGASSLSAGNFGSPVPVVITGTQNPNEPHFPGLREAMIGSAIYQLAQQIPPDSRFAEQIKELALALHRSGAEKILANRSDPVEGNPKPRKKPTRPRR